MKRLNSLREDKPINILFAYILDRLLKFCNAEIIIMFDVSYESSVKLGIQYMSSAKRRLERNSPSIFTPLFSQFNLLNMLSNVAVNSLGEMVSPCLTPLLILIFSLSLCRCTVTELSVKYYMYFRISMYTSSIPCSCNDVNIAWVCTESNAFS